MAMSSYSIFQGLIHETNRELTFFELLNKANLNF